MDNMQNPFNLILGLEPTSVVNRIEQTNEIVSTFMSNNPTSPLYVISGVRGSGKTVFMQSVADTIMQNSKKGEWIEIDLNPETDLLENFAASLSRNNILENTFLKADISFSIFGATLTFGSKDKCTSVEVAIDRMLEIVSKLDKKILITIDEVTSKETLRIFASQYQIWLRKKYPVFLLMTGLFENIRNLQDTDSLTFLYRAPKIDIKPLGIKGMSVAYKKFFDISDDEIKEMALFTKGYSYAYQVLGYLKWRNPKASIEELTPEFDVYMEDNVYEKIWSGLSEGDKQIIGILAKNGKMKTKNIQELSGNTSSSYSTYRRRLQQKGLICTDEYGTAELSLPRFGEIILEWI